MVSEGGHGQVSFIDPFLILSPSNQSQCFVVERMLDQELEDLDYIMPFISIDIFCNFLKLVEPLVFFPKGENTELILATSWSLCEHFVK